MIGDEYLKKQEADALLYVIISPVGGDTETVLCAERKYSQNKAKPEIPPSLKSLKEADRKKFHASYNFLNMHITTFNRKTWSILFARREKFCMEE